MRRRRSLAAGRGGWLRAPALGDGVSARRRGGGRPRHARPGPAWGGAGPGPGPGGGAGGRASPALAASLGHVAPSGPKACGGGEGLARLLRSETTHPTLPLPTSPRPRASLHRCSLGGCRWAALAPRGAASAPAVTAPGAREALPPLRARPSPGATAALASVSPGVRGARERSSPRRRSRLNPREDRLII